MINKSHQRKQLLNKDFRQSLSLPLIVTNYAAQLNGKEAGKTAVRNIFVKPDFVQADGKTLSYGDGPTSSLW